MDFNGNTYVSINGTCVVKEKTTGKQQSRCLLCDKGRYTGSSYYGAGDNTLSFDNYELKFVFNLLLI